MKNKTITLNPEEAWILFKTMRGAHSAVDFDEMKMLRLKKKLKRLVVKYYPIQENAQI